MVNNILVLTYWPYRTGLIQAYTLPYLRMISQYLREGNSICLVTMERPETQLNSLEVESAIQGLALDRIEWVPFPYFRFGLKAVLAGCANLIRLILLMRKRKFSVIHCFCTPAGVNGFILSKITGVPLVIDSYEPHAEAMVENGAWKKYGLAFNILFFLEKLQTRRAKAIVATTPGMLDYAKTRYSTRIERFFVKPACVDLDHFQRDGQVSDSFARDLGLEDKVVCVYAGKIGGIYLEREIFDLLKAGSNLWGSRFRALFLTSESKERLQLLCEASKFDYGALIHKFVDHRDIPKYMALAHFAITPVRPVPTKSLCTPIKDGEYWAMGLPVIISPNISDDSRIIQELGIGAVLAGFTEVAYAKAMREIEHLIRTRSREDLYVQIREVARERRGQQIAAKVYAELYGPKSLINWDNDRSLGDSLEGSLS